jgi:hypothetical protein
VASGAAALYCYSGIVMLGSFRSAAGGGSGYDRRALPWEVAGALSRLVMPGLLSMVFARWMREAREAA